MSATPNNKPRPLALAVAAALALAGVTLHVRPVGVCSPGMVLVIGGGKSYCIDAYEEVFHQGRWVSRPGLRPGPAAVSWAEAKVICKSKGGWLCTSDQWEDACDGRVGPGGAAYPYGDRFRQRTCNTVSRDRTASEARNTEDRDLRHATLGGALPGCVSVFGAYDMSGNYWEWTDPGTGDTDKRGGAYYSGNPTAAACASSYTGHKPGHKGTITFRCCARPRPPEVHRPWTWYAK